MAIKLVSSGSSVKDPTVVNLPASGTIRANSLVIFDTANDGNALGYSVSPASTSLATGSAILGVSLDGVAGKSDAFVRVILFEPGQLWEVDVLNLIDTTQVLKRHQMYDLSTVQNTSFDQSESVTGVFFCLAISGASSGSAKLIGEFLRTPRMINTVTSEFK